MPPVRLPLATALDLFLDAKRAERRAPRTIENYRDLLTRANAWLHDHGVFYADEITPQLIRSYLRDLAERQYTAWTVHDYGRALRAWLRFLIAEDLLTTDPLRNVTIPAPGKAIGPAFTRDDVRKLLAAATNARDKTLLLFLVDSGVRASELCALAVPDVDLATGAVLVRRGKGGKPRTTYIGARTKREVLKHLLGRTTGPLFTTTDDRPFTRNLLLKTCQRIGQRAGVAHCHPHTFRRTFALWSLRAGMNIYILQSMLGHTTLELLRTYLALVDTDRATAHQEHGPVDHQL